MTALVETERPQKAAAAAVGASLEGVTHRYGKTVALDNVTIAIPAGRMTGLIGPDGVGKSTLLGLIAGVRMIQTGEVRALGGDLRDAAFRQGAYARIAYMPQGLGRNLYPTLSVFENMDFIGRLFGQGEAERKARIDDLTRSTGLDPFLARPAGKLSGGMKQKLSLCCSLIHDPDLLILDEPTTGVDPLSRRQFWELIDRIRARRPQMSVVVATAYMDEAEQYAWLAAMDGGHVIATGSPAEIKSRVGAKDLESAFIALLPEEKRKGHKALEIPPLKHEGGTPAIEAVGLTKRFDKFVAVDHVSFKIEKGEIFGFLGSNGCGKSTTMKMLTGLLPPTEGTAKLFGEPVSGKEDMSMRRRVGYMSQAFSLYGELSVRRNLELHAQLFDLPVATRGKRVDEMLDRFGLREVADVEPESLPLGIRQRLQLAVAIQHRPELLILDEPTSGVDPVARDQFWEHLIALSRNDGVTVFISTHFMNEAMRCDRISLMNAGKVLAAGTPPELIEARHAKSLEEAFIEFLEDAAGDRQLLRPARSGLVPLRRRARHWVRLSVVLVPADQRRRLHQGARLSRALAQPSGARGLYRRLSWRGGAHSAETGVLNVLRKLLHILALGLKELNSIRADPILLALTVYTFSYAVYAVATGAKTEVDHVSTAIVDEDRSELSRLLRQAILPPWFQPPVEIPATEIGPSMDASRYVFVIEIPPKFEQDVISNRYPSLQINMDATAVAQAGNGGAYLQQIINQQVQAHATRAAGTPTTPGRTENQPVNFAVRVMFNPNLKSEWFNSVMQVINNITMLSIILTGAALIREREHGTIEHLLAMPVTPSEIMLSKIWANGLVILVAALLSMKLVVQLWLQVPIAGSLVLFLAGALVYAFSVTSMGILLATYTTSMGQFGLLVIPVLVILQMLSGSATPMETMPVWLQDAMQIFPTPHFVSFSQAVLYRAAGLDVVWPELLVMAIISAFYFAVSGVRFRKTLVVLG